MYYKVNYIPYYFLQWFPRISKYEILFAISYMKIKYYLTQKEDLHIYQM